MGTLQPDQTGSQTSVETTGAPTTATADPTVEQTGPPTAATDTRSQHIELPKSSIVQFVPFPHRELNYGHAAFCDWKSLEEDDPIVTSLIGSQEEPLDAIQLSALNETICIPQNETFLTQLHLFSMKDAKQCLANVTLIVLGDSYNMQLFIGLADILLGNPANLEIQNGTHRNKAVAQAQTDLRTLNGIVDVRFPDKERDCYGAKQPFSEYCGTYIQNFRNNNLHKPIVPVVGAGMQIFRSYGDDANATIEEYKKLFANTTEVIFNSPPSYQKSKIPIQYQFNHKGSAKYYWEFVPHISSYEIRFLDFFQLTQSCTMENCTPGSRFVNRWKAQLLLNTICSYGHSNSNI